MSFASTAFAAYPYAAFGAGASTSAATPTAPVVGLTASIVDGDTVRDANGDLVAATDPIAEEVAFYVGTLAGHFFGDPEVGNGSFRVRVLDKRSQVAIRDLVLRALRPMIERGDIKNVRVSPEPVVRNGTAINFYTVSYGPTNAVRR